MRNDRIEGKWIDTFARAFALSRIGVGDTVAILSETLSRALNVQLAELALHRLGARAFHMIAPSPPQQTPVPSRSTGASDALSGLAPLVAGLAEANVVIDCTVEGLMHAPELPAILAKGARVINISNEHPEALERLVPTEADKERVRIGIKRLKEAREMHVTSAAGTDLRIVVEGAVPGGIWGFTDRPGTLTHWPGGLCLCFPKAGSTNGTLVLDRGDLNLTFKRYLETPVRLRIEDDYVTAVEGDGLDAELMRSYFAAWGERDVYAVSHVGWGMNAAARWDALTMYDKNQTNGTEQRAFAGNFLYSTGANEVAGRHTLGHFDLPMRNCTIALDGEPIVEAGDLRPPLA